MIISLTPLDSSFSTAAFSRAMSPRTILKTSCFQRLTSCLIKKQPENQFPSNQATCITAESVKGDFHMLGHCTMTKAEKCH